MRRRKVKSRGLKFTSLSRVALPQADGKRYQGRSSWANIGPADQSPERAEWFDE